MNDRILFLRCRVACDSRGALRGFALYPNGDLVDIFEEDGYERGALIATLELGPAVEYIEALRDELDASP